MAVVGIEPPPSTLLLLIHLGANCSALAYGLLGYGLSRLEAGRVATIFTLEPVIGVAAAVLHLGESLAGGQFAGGGLILAGAWLAAGGRTPGTVPRPPDSGAATSVAGLSPTEERAGRAAGRRPWHRARLPLVSTERRA